MTRPLLLFFLMLPVVAQAQTYTREAMIACPATAWVAGDIMERRQTGEPKANLVREMQQQSSPKMREHGLYMIDAAYLMPIVSGQAKSMIVQGFRDSFYVYCLNQVSRIK